MWPAKAVHYHIGFLCRHLAIGCDEDLHLLVSPVAVGKDHQQEAKGNAFPTSARTEAQATLPVTPGTKPADRLNHLNTAPVPNLHTQRSP